MNLPFLPTLNAFLNATAGILLFLGWRAIKAQKKELHQKLMVSAFITSMLFLVSYLTYHLTTAGITHYSKEGIWRVIYFFILLTHTPLAGLIVPASVAAIWFAYKKDFTRHTRVTKLLFPTWMYVSVTGVLIYLMLYIF